MRADWQCYGKQTYPDKGVAEKRLKQMLRHKKGLQRWTKGMKLVPYRCRLCESWHIGNGFEEVGW